MREVICERKPSCKAEACVMPVRAVVLRVVRCASLAAGACLFVCLPLCMGVSIPSLTAYAATFPVSSSQTDAAVGFHEEYDYAGSRYVHSGVDLAAKPGSEVVAPVESVVSFVGSVPAGDEKLSGVSNGSTMEAVSLRMSDGRVITLMPFEAVEVSRGESLGEGAVVGRLAVGGDKSSKGTHLHMGLKKGSAYYDPMSLFANAQAGRAPSSEAEALAGGKKVRKFSPQLDATPQEALPPSLPDAGQAPLGQGLEAIGSSVPVQVRDEFGSISSQAGAETTTEAVAASDGSQFLSSLLYSCSKQLDSLASGFAKLCDKLHVKYQLAAVACALFLIAVVSAAVCRIVGFIRRSNAGRERGKKNSLHGRNGGDNIQKLFPAPGTSFITRGRLAQRR